MQDNIANHRLTTFQFVSVLSLLMSVSAWAIDTVMGETGHSVLLTVVDQLGVAVYWPDPYSS